MRETSQAVRDAALSVAAVAILTLSIVAVNQPVREQVLQLVGHESPAAALSDAGGTVRAVAMVLYVAVRDQTVAHAPLATFAAVAGVLFIFMLRL